MSNKLPPVGHSGVPTTYCIQFDVWFLKDLCKAMLLYPCFRCSLLTTLRSLCSLSVELKSSQAVQHALKIRRAYSAHDYVNFFRLYDSAPNLNKRLLGEVFESLLQCRSERAGTRTNGLCIHREWEPCREMLTSATINICPASVLTKSVFPCRALKFILYLSILS
jgi:hypothetical protein